LEAEHAIRDNGQARKFRLFPPGAPLVFDSTLRHAPGANMSGADRLAIDHQFTRSFFKQQID
jgi:ectoine hydroxylase-related dioxygenase (phytanoyl-CoA dioxygenase family)